MVIGATLAARTDTVELGATVLAFFLAVGIAAHALDELHGRPLHTQIPGRVLIAAAAGAMVGALALGCAGVARVGAGLLVFMVIGPILVLGYNLEILGGKLHTDIGFAAAWGAFPVLTAYFVQTGTLDLTALVGALAALALSLAQRALSTQARFVRRRVAHIDGTVREYGGDIRAIDEQFLLGAIERALRWMTYGVVLFAIALLAARV